MKAFVKIFFTLILVVLFAGGGAYFVNKNFILYNQIHVSKAESSAQNLLYEKIQQDLVGKLEIFEKKPIWDVSLTEIMSTLDEDIRISKATVRRSFPNNIFVEITPRKPLLLLLGLKGEFFPVASDASLLPPVPVGQSPDLPILRGLHFFKNDGQRKRLIQMMSLLPEEGMFSQKTISEVRMEKQNEVTFFLSDSSMKVLVGQDLDQGQVSRIEQVLKYLSSRSIKGRVIDARFSKKVVVRVRNAS